MEKTILLVDDEIEIIDIQKRYLIQAGYQVLVARDGLEGLDIFRKKTVDLIITDIMMPKMDGYKATQKIRHLPDKDKACIPIIAMTASAFEEDKREAIAAGMNGHIAKPIDVNELMAILVKNTR